MATVLLERGPVLPLSTAAVFPPKWLLGVPKWQNLGYHSVTFVLPVAWFVLDGFSFRYLIFGHDGA